MSGRLASSAKAEAEERGWCETNFARASDRITQL
jgi:hypothetical protein